MRKVLRSLPFVSAGGENWRGTVPTGCLLLWGLMAAALDPLLASLTLPGSTDSLSSTVPMTSWKLWTSSSGSFSAHHCSGSSSCWKDTSSPDSASCGHASPSAGTDSHSIEPPGNAHRCGTLKAAFQSLYKEDNDTHSRDRNFLPLPQHPHWHYSTGSHSRQGIVLL